MKKLILLFTTIANFGVAHAEEGNSTYLIKNDNDAERAQACIRHSQAQAQLIKNKAQLVLMTDYELSNGASEKISDLRQLNDLPDKVLNYGVTTGATIGAVGAASLALRQVQQHAKVVVKTGARLPFFPTILAKRILTGGIAVAGSSALISFILDKAYVNSEVNIARKEMLDFLDSTQDEEKRSTREDMKKYLQEESARLIQEQKQLNQIIDQLLPADARNDQSARCKFDVSTQDKTPYGTIH